MVLVSLALLFVVKCFNKQKTVYLLFRIDLDNTATQ